MKNKKKAFTLTELLVVVIVIGVLSAAVLPKFSKVIETRKTTEAEELMASIRTEQEKRCALDKPYLTDLSQMNDVIKTASTKNYQINLQNKGINAASKGNYSYTLQMPSYADGRICCDGADCEKLNKNYPSCTGFTYEPSPDSCAGTVTPVEPEIKSCSGSSTQACGCQNKGTQSRTCNTTTGEWSDWGACSVSDECECTGTKPDAIQDCNTCGTQMRSVTCDTTTGEWKTGEWGMCSKTVEECNPCPENKFPGEGGICICKNYADAADCKDQEEWVQVNMTLMKKVTVSYTWNDLSCTCEREEPDVTEQDYYFKCVERITNESGAQAAYNSYASKSAAQTACESGKDTSATYEEYLSGGDPVPGCKEYIDDNGRLVSCALTPSYFIKYKCSTEPPQPCSGYGFCEEICMVVVPHD